MANPDHVNKLNTLDKDEWRAWRRENLDLVPDLSMLDHDAVRDDSGYPESPRNLAGYDLSHANLRDANLMKANLSRADLSSADLSHAALIGTNLSWTQIWKAGLFETSDQTDFSRLVNCSCRKITRASKLVRRLEIASKSASPDQKGKSALYFRGEPEIYPKLRPSVMRCRKLSDAEDELLINLVIRRPEEMEAHQLYFQRLVVARHYDLPTRLLDITRNPLVGLFYASGCACQNGNPNCGYPDGVLHEFQVDPSWIKPFDSDTVSLLSNFTRLTQNEKNTILTRPVDQTIQHAGAADNMTQSRLPRERTLTRLRHFIAQEKPYWEERIDMRDLFRVLVVEPQRQFDRLRAHSGAFMLSAFHESFDRVEVDKWFEGAAPYTHRRFVVPHEEKCKIRRHLKSLNISEEVLMADLQSAASAVTSDVQG